MFEYQALLAIVPVERQDTSEKSFSNLEAILLNCVFVVPAIVRGFSMPFFFYWTLRSKMAILMLDIAFDLVVPLPYLDYCPSPRRSPFLMETFPLVFFMLLTRTKFSFVGPPFLLVLDSLQVSSWM